MTDQQDFPQFLRERIKRQNISLRRLSELSGVPGAHLENMLRDEMDELPAAPYVRGYLKHLGEALDFDPEPWWLQLKRAGEVRASGGGDKLPRNRFALKAGRKYGWLIAAGVLLLIYFGSRFSNILGKPTLTVHNPPEALVEVRSDSITVAGRVRGGDQVLVNNEPVPFGGAEGIWEKRVTLEPGLNTIEITATKFLGGKTSLLRQVLYEPAPEPPSPAPDSL